MSATPTVSAIMAVYNERAYVEAAIESVLGQTFEDFELIIIDDGSTDGSTEILQRYAANDERIELIVQENKGIPRTLNRGLATARGEYFARMDADDISLPTRFQMQVDYLEDHPDCVAVGCDAVAIDPDGHPLHDQSDVLPSGNAHRATLAYDHESLVAGMLGGKWVAFFQTAMVRRSAIQQVGGYDEQYEVAEDLDLFLRLSEVGQFVNLPHILYEYRHHEEQISNRSATLRYLTNKVRRAAHRRRNKPLPSTLRMPAMIRSWVGMMLRKAGLL
jgi:glycosyltransferase involved in cell wall biosynthesis